MSTSDTTYSVGWYGPELLQRNRANSVTCPVERSGVAATVTAATFTLKQGGAILLSVAADTLSPPTYAVSGATLTSLSYGMGYTVEWAVAIGGVSYTFDRPCCVCRRALFPVVKTSDLVDLHGTITSLMPSGQTAQGWIDLAWKQIQRRIIAAGHLPQTNVEPDSLRDVHTYLALHLMFTSWSTALNSGAGTNRWADLAKDYGEKYERAWKGVAWLSDIGEDGVPDSTTNRKAAVNQYMTVEPRPHAAGAYGRSWGGRR
ncbi:MAG: hypothetical protein Q8P18_18355 [Pseudomonadota bacterium]|nr:hypothetical protein [Pseudomonadota bacterium]